MKTKLLLITLILFNNLMSIAQYVTYDKCLVEFENYANTPGCLIYENDSLKFEFSPKSDSSWPIIITNKTNTICSINWEKGIFECSGESGRILFSDDSRITKDREKQPSKILPGSALKKDLFPDVCVLSNTVVPIYYKKIIKKGGIELIRLAIPVSFDGIERLYMFKFKIYFPVKKES